MRKISLSLLAFFGLLAGISAQEKRQVIEASGKIISREVAVQSFNELDVSGLCNVVLSQDGKEQVKIDADDNLQSLIDVKNEGNTLKVSMKKDLEIKGNAKITIYVNFKSLKNMAFQTVGNVTTAKSMSFSDLKILNNSVGNVALDLSANALNIENTSVGNLSLKGKASSAVIKNSGVGSLRAGELVVEKMDISNTGVGGADVNASKELKVKDSFLGKVKNSGAATARRMNKVVI